MAREFIDTLLLLALPASGKSEVRRFMLHTPQEQRIPLYHISDTTQLDDFPYVHFMRMVDEALESLGQERRFYKGPNDRFIEPRDWGTLLHLVNHDFAVMKDPSRPLPPAEAQPLFKRIDAARRAVGGPVVFEALDLHLREILANRLQPEAERAINELLGGRPDDIHERTLVIEFARGGPEGADMPLDPPHGYRWNLAQLSPEILERAAILYIWVTPEESRRKNIARADPDDPGSVLHHSAPESVMRNDYGICDMEWLLEQAEQPDTIEIEAHGRTWVLPVARFDNRVDKTSFVRDEPEQWRDEDVKALHEGLTNALDRLWKSWKALHDEE